MRRICLVLALAFTMITISAMSTSAHYKAGSLNVGVSSTINTGCNGHEVIPHHDPSPGVWWTPKKVGVKRLIVHFWTNWPGRDQSEFKVKIPATANVELAGGGSHWWFSCKDGWNTSYANDPLPGHTLKWMKNHGLARNR